MLAFKFSNDRIILSIKDEKHNNPGSSSGRTKDSGSFNGGSNPSPGVFKDTFRCFLYGESSNTEIFSYNSKLSWFYPQGVPSSVRLVLLAN